MDVLYLTYWLENINSQAWKINIGAMANINEWLIIISNVTNSSKN